MQKTNLPVIISKSLPPVTSAEKAADWAIAHLHDNGFTAYRVGGCVRDRLIGSTANDADVVTNAPPENVRKIFPKTYAVGEHFGVVIVHTPLEEDIEVATFRSETAYTDGRRPEKVTFTTASEDTARRDFTINGLLYNPKNHCIIDYACGLKDLQQGLLRAIGNAEQRFREDHLRMLRAIRFAARLGFQLTPATAKAICEHAPLIKRISVERIFKEITRMITGPAPDRALQMMLDLNILGHILPEVANMHGVPQPPEFHPEGNVWQHTLLMFQHMRWRTPALAWSCLLHDVGKPPTYIVEDRIRFPKHALESARMSSDILTRMHASRQLIDTVTQATKNHMKFADVLNMKNSTILNMIDAPTFPVELELHRLDCISSHRKLDCYLKLVDKLVELKDKPPVPPPLITGNDLLTLGIPEGPVIGRILKSVQEKTLNGEISTREEALATACQEKDAILE